MSKLKKLAKIGAGLGAAYLGSKMLGKSKVTDTADLGKESSNVSALIKGNTENTRGALKKAMKMKKKMTPSYSGSDFGLGPMDGAKTGKMIKAKGGTMVMAKGCKLGRKKPTRIT